MSIETAGFAVERNGSLFKCLGSEISTKLQSTDLLVVQRGEDTFKLAYSNVVTNLQNSDILACTDTDGISYRVTGSQFSSLL